jgi:carotenoid cleavage dioxygenase-like enzyme
MNATELAERAVAWTTQQMRKRAPYSGDNEFLQGPYAPVSDELTETELRVTGKLPVEMNGLFARIGPNPIEVANPGSYHWFIGDGMVHGVRLREGKALWYRNRWIGTNSANAALGRPALPGKRHGIFDTVNTNVIGHAGRIWAMVEAGPMPVELDECLESVRHSYFESDAVRSFSAHPHRDPATGDLHAICYDGMVQNRISYVRIGADGRLARTVDIPVKGGPSVHDCAITASKVVVLDLPVTFSGRAAMSGASFPYRWNPAHAARVGVLPHDGEAADTRWFDVDPCYVFHTANAYDRPDGGVVVDVVVHSTMFDESMHGPDSKKITFERWTLDPARSDVQRTVISDRHQEFPRFDERVATQPNRYAYTVGTDFGGAGPEPLICYDLEKGTSVVHDYGPNQLTAEAVFVPRANAGAENDGWLVSYVYDLREGRSDFVIVNAADISGEAEAIVHLPGRVPLGFHGNWIADPALSR